MKPTDYVQLGKSKGYIEILDNGTAIRSVVPDQKYKFSDPEEQVRARYYVELIEKYQYPQERIDLEVTVPRRTPSDSADIVIFRQVERSEDSEKTTHGAQRNANPKPPRF